MSIRQHQFHLLLHSADLLEDRLRLQLAPLGIGPRQARVIDAMHRMGETSQAALAREFNVKQASMSTMTARLITAGYILRRKDPDDVRGNLLSLTKKGEEMLTQIEVVWDEIDAFAAAAIGAERFDRLTHQAGALRDALGGRRPGTQRKATRAADGTT